MVKEAVAARVAVVLVNDLTSEIALFLFSLLFWTRCLAEESTFTKVPFVNLTSLVSYLTAVKVTGD